MKTFLFLLLSLFISSVPLSAQTQAERIDRLVKSYNELEKFSGSILVSKNGKVLYKGGVGLANMEWDIANQANTKHRLGSITKQFTAMLIMQLVEEGKLKLDEPITSYLPDYPKNTGDKITLHHLLTHTSGIPNYTALPNFFKDISIRPYTPDEFVNLFSDKELEFEPGEKFNYSNSGYFLLGAIIEKITGNSYEKVLHDKIFQPLGMHDTGYDNHHDILKNRATGYEKSGISYRNSNYLDMSIPYAAGSMYSTVEDLYKWDQALYSDQLVDKKYLDLSFEKYAPAFGDAYYGYGWIMNDIPVGNTEEMLPTIGHGGGINGFNTLITRFEDKSMVVLLNNTSNAPLSEMTVAITGILHDKTYDFPKKSVAQLVTKVIEKQGPDAGIKLFNSLKNDDNYELDESEINSIGYSLMSEGDYEKAAVIFKLNMEAFPNSFNTYDSYGEVLMKLGKKEEAIANYRKSIEMNPGNQNGIDMLKEMGVNTDDLVEDIIIADEILMDYVGEYELMPGFILSISKEGSQMKAQATGQSQFDIFPKSENVFFLKAIEAQITFNKNDKGLTESLTLLQNEREITGKKM